jgi:predicted RNA-binding protein with RPS1 domain
MSDSTKVIAPPEEQEGELAVPATPDLASEKAAGSGRDVASDLASDASAQGSEARAEGTDASAAASDEAGAGTSDGAAAGDGEAPIVVGVGTGVEPGPETRGAFRTQEDGTQEHTSVGSAPEASDAAAAVAEPPPVADPEEAAGAAETPAAPQAGSDPAPAAPATEARAAAAAEATAADGEAPEVGADAPSAAEQVTLDSLRKARDERRPVQGRVFGWNPGGFHVVIDGVAAFVPRSEMELEPIADPQSYLDKTFDFRVLKVQGKARRVVLSRTALLREEQEHAATETRQKLQPGSVLKGKVSSLTDFGAFVDLGGVEGLVHVSEISQRRVAKPSDALQVGQEVEVKVLKVEKGGRRVSLSIKALEPDPWREVKEKYTEGAVVTGKVERIGPPGAFIELEPGLVGLLPTSEMGLPREAIPARAYPPGKQVTVQVVGVDPRRRRISLAPEGSRVEGTRGDYAAYVKQQRKDEAVGFKPFAAALQKLKRDQ